jgi:hypothetical protein
LLPPETTYAEVPTVVFEIFIHAINIPMPETVLFRKIEPPAAQLLLASGISRADFARLNNF